MDFLLAKNEGCLASEVAICLMKSTHDSYLREIGVLIKLCGECNIDWLLCLLSVTVNNNKTIGRLAAGGGVNTLFTSRHDPVTR